MRDAKHLVQTNYERVHDAGNEAHKALSQMDIQQFNSFSRTSLGRAMMEVANQFADEHLGLKKFYEGMYG